MVLIKNIGMCNYFKRLFLAIVNWSPWFLLFIGFLITSFLAFSFKSMEDAKVQNQVSFIGKQIQTNVEACLDVHEEVLKGAVALFEASDNVDRQKWRSYTKQVKRDNNFKGFQGLGFALLIPSDQLPAHIAEVRRAGFPDYNVWPNGTRDIYTSVIYWEPFEEHSSKALGYDMRVEPEHQIAMEKARDGNKATFTGKVALISKSEQDVQPGVVIYVPVYRKNMPIDTVQQRRIALLGWVYSSFRIKDLMQGIKLIPNQENLRMKIFDGSGIASSALLYASDEDDFSYGDKFPADTLILHSYIGEREWTFQFFPITEYFISDYGKVALIAVSGSIITLLVFFLIYSYRNTQRNAELIADNLIAELRQSENRYHIAETEFSKMQKQLQQAHKMEILGQLTGGIAHDFNNILAIMLGYSNLALARCVTDKESTLARHLEETIKAGERARDLVSFMLTYSRAQTDNLVEVIDPLPLVKDALKMLSVTIPSSIKLQSQIDTEASYIRINSVELYQIIMNLIINARDSIETDNNGCIDIRLSNSSSGEAEEFCTSCKQSKRIALCRGKISDNYVSFSVTDNGCGISDDNFPLIFNPFFSTKDAGKGTGLGLSVVLSIVRRINGCIVVDSHVGGGTKVQVLLPAAYDSLVLPATAASSTVSGGKGARVLVVDDEIALAHYLGDLLEGEDYVVDVYTDSVKALNHFQANPQRIDAVIADQTMPNKSGIEIAGVMLALRPDLPIFLCSGNSSAINENDLRSIGIRRFFYKPVSATELLAALNEEIVHSAQATFSA
ncbi:CHASE domain-containing protein [Candidatus Methylobacter oryzae]|uniref:histidine kinase n=1 Tax=Candidatus Methylobacter oryzae TaxID=2497749 RepID=A0ABY3CG05_9GAMM|nr:CHASE domain-containing protein [Candidatus Methylobacter oryzae]TRX02636.1 response regulator [Candidatus Methylobacter oryzae]